MADVDLGRVVDTFRRGGPAAVESALAGVPGAPAAAVRRAVAGHAHLLGPLEPPHAAADLLLDVLATVDELRRAVEAYERPAGPRLAGRDRPAAHPALRRMIGVPGETVELVVAPDGRWFAVAGRDGGLRLHDTATGAVRLRLLGPARTVTAVTISSDGARVAAAQSGGQLLVWAVTGSAPGLSVRLPADARQVAFTPDGTQLVVSTTAEVLLLDAFTGVVRKALAARPGTPVERFAVMPGGTRLVVAFGSDGRPVELWDLRSGAVRVLPVDSAADDVVPGLDGTWLMTVAWCRTMIWDLAAGRVRREVEADDEEAQPASVAPGGVFAMTAAGRDLRRWDLATGALDATVPGLGEGRPYALSPDGSWLARAADGAVGIWDLGAWAAAGGSGRPAPRRLGALTATTGTWLVVEDGEPRGNGPVHLVDVSTGAAGPPIGAAHRLACAIAPDGSWLAVTAGDRGVRIWNLPELTERVVLPCHTGHFAVAPDGGWLVTWDRRQVAYRWDTATGAALGTVSGAGHRITAVAIAPGGGWLAAADDHREIRIRHVVTDRTRRVLRGHTDVVHALAIAPDGGWLAAAGGPEVRIWNPADGRTVAILGGLTGGARGVSVSPDGAWLAGADRAGVVRVWSTADWRLRAATRIDDQTLTGCQWFADGTAISVTGGHTVHLLDFSPATAPAEEPAAVPAGEPATA